MIWLGMLVGIVTIVMLLWAALDRPHNTHRHPSFTEQMWALGRVVKEARKRL